MDVTYSWGNAINAFFNKSIKFHQKFSYKLVAYAGVPNLDSLRGRASVILVLSDVRRINWLALRANCIIIISHCSWVVATAYTISHTTSVASIDLWTICKPRTTLGRAMCYDLEHAYAKQKLGGGGYGGGLWEGQIFGVVRGGVKNRQKGLKKGHFWPFLAKFG